jgi:CPA2 family monovalent cation:H+ antiporter-2
MAGTIDVAGMKDALVVLAAAGVVVPIGRRLKISPVIAFLVAGAVLGPDGLGRLATTWPWIDWITIDKRETISAIAELGVVFLLFVIGLELSLPRLITMRRLVFGLGAAQVLLSALAIGAGASLFLPVPAAMVLGSGLALSSTAIVIEVLAAEKRTTSATGRAGFAVLLFQDLAVVPLLFLIGALAGPREASVLAELEWGLLQAAGTIGAIVAAGHFLLRPLFRLVARPDNPELFMAATLFVAIGTGVMAASAGLSMALGAFIAGLLLAETEYRRAIEATIDPFKSLLLGVFFFAVGMSLDLALVVAHLPLVLVAVLALVVLKAALIVGLGPVFRLPPAVAIETAMLLAPAGEFAFVLFALAVSTDVLSREAGSIAVAVASLSMVFIPPLGALGRRMGRRWRRVAVVDPELAALPPRDEAERAVVVGFGRVGCLVAEMLERHQISYIAADANARAVAHWRRLGKPVFWGDATNGAFLERCGLQKASALVVTIDNPLQVENVVAAAQAIRPDLVIVARCRDADHARDLYRLGVTDAVPETIEASLQLSEAALAGLGVAAGPVIASIHERRDEFRRELQTAAGRPTRAVQPKRRLIGR